METHIPFGEALDRARKIFFEKNNVAPTRLIWKEIPEEDYKKALAVLYNNKEDF